MTDPLKEPLVLRPELAIEQLERLHEWYSGQEARYYEQLWGGESARWEQCTENEWHRYRTEAAALRAGIEAIKLRRAEKLESGK